jgi:hypothetical protein
MTWLRSNNPDNLNPYEKLILSIRTVILSGGEVLRTADFF